MRSAFTVIEALNCAAIVVIIIVAVLISTATKARHMPSSVLFQGRRCVVLGRDRNVVGWIVYIIRDADGREVRVTENELCALPQPAEPAR